MQTAMATLRFEYFYQKCMNYCQPIPSTPRIDQDFEYNKPWAFSHEYDKSNIWKEIENWKQDWETGDHNKNNKNNSNKGKNNRNKNRNNKCNKVNNNNNNDNSDGDIDINFHTSELEEL